MLLKLLSLAALACVSAESTNHSLRPHDRNHEHERSLQAAATCMFMGTPFTECCPCAKPDDGICTLVWCFDLNELEIHDECNCGQLAGACDQLGWMLGMIDGLTEMCAEVKECCGTTEASNGDFDVCIADGAVPDFAIIIPFTDGGMPDMSSMGSPICAELVSGEATETAATKGVIVTSPTVPSEGIDLSSEPVIDTSPTVPSEGVVLRSKPVVVTLPTEPSKGVIVTDGVVVTLRTVPVTEAPKTTAETPVTEAPADTTGTPEVDDTTTDDTLSPDDGLNGANKYTVGTLMTLVGCALSILFV